MYLVYKKSDGYRLLFFASDYELNLHSFRLEEKDTLWTSVVEGCGFARPCLWYREETENSDPVARWLSKHHCQVVLTRCNGMFIVFPTSKIRNVYIYLFGSVQTNYILPVDDKRPLFDCESRLTVKRFYSVSTVDVASSGEGVDVVIARNLLMSSAGRRLATDYQTWIRVLFVLVNEFKQGEENDAGLKLWIDFSKLCPEKFNECMCNHLWRVTEKREITSLNALRFGSLLYMLKTSVRDP